ncbi:MAG: DUF349 domain-containing protein [Proteobacteria bacterium]|nr:DUF349 domain-containing protein [Pseudomonadota bacterium]
MSLFSRFFRKAPPTPAVTEVSARPPAPEVRPAAPTPDRALEAAKEETVLQAAIDRNDPDAIARLVVAGKSTRIRQLAAHAVNDPARLRDLIREVRGGNDKSVYKILTSKRDAHLAEARQQGQVQEELNTAAAAVERHSHRPYDALFGPTLDQLEIRWKGVATHASADQLEQVRQAIDRSREIIASHLRQVAVEASRQLAAENAAAEAQRVRELEQKTAAAAAAERAQVEEAARKERADQLAAEALAFRQIGGLIRKARGALDEGSTGRAAGLRRVIEEKLAGAPPLSPYLTNQLHGLDTRLTELEDWKSFSVAPKRAELLEEIESLVDSTLDPPVLAERIKGLQEEWRTLSKGAGENLEEDWQRFQGAARKAYQPCREYFEAQSLVRQENLQRRAALLARLAAFANGHDWEHPDWRLVLVALRESKQLWRQHSPVDRAAARELQEQFVAVTSQLQDRLDAAYAAHVGQKKSLIERAQQLSLSEDSRKAIDEVKELQRRWQSVGVVPRDEDHRLWEEFRLHCDAVFQRRQQENAEYNAALEANRVQAVAACEELEGLSKLSGAQLLGSTAHIAELRNSFAALGEFPRGAARELRNRFERALDQCEAAVERQKLRDTEQSWSSLLEVANRVRAYKLALLSEPDAALHASLRAAAETHFAAVTRWPRGGSEAVKTALEKAAGADLEANEKALRMLCIRAEILADRPSPAEDQPLRREYQVQRLMQAMGQGVTADATEMDTLTLEWVQAGPIEEGRYAQLLERFKECRPH